MQVVATNTDDYALDDTGAVWAWGAAAAGELGAGRTRERFTTTPTRVRFPAGVEIASLTNTMPDATAMAIDTQGHVWGWGENGSRQLCSRARDIPRPVMVSLPDVTLASGAGDHALYDSDGTGNSVTAAPTMRCDRFASRFRAVSPSPRWPAAARASTRSIRPGRLGVGE